MNVSAQRNQMLSIENEKHFDKIGQDGAGIVSHQVREMSSESRRGFFKMVVGDFGKQMVDLVRANIVDQIMGPAIMPIHGA